MNNILKTVKEFPTWEKVVIASLMFVPIPFSIGMYLGARTMYKKMKNNTEIKKDEL